MIKFVKDETRSVESVTNFLLEESMNIFIMQLNNALKYFYTFFPRVHSTSARTVNAEVIELTILTSKDP